MATVDDVLSIAIPSKLLPTVEFTRQKKDPWMARLIRTSTGAFRLGYDTSNWYFRKTVGMGLGGTVRYLSGTSPAILSGAQPMTVPTEVRTFPSPMETVQPGYDYVVGRIAEMKGNIAIDVRTLMANSTDGNITDHYQNMMDGVALNITLTQASALYTPSSTTRHICTVASWTLVDANNGSFIPAEGNEVLFHEGQYVQMYLPNTATTVQHRHTALGTDDSSVQIMVMGVDPTTRRVYVRDVAGLGRLNLAGNAVADGDLVVHRGQLSGGASGGGTAAAVGPYGLVDWIINTGSLLGVLDTSRFLRLRSFIRNSLGGPWTEQEADRMLTFYNRWHDKPITDLYTTPGVLLAYKDTMLGMFRADRTAEPARIVGGHVADTHIYNGKKVNYWATPYMRSGTMIGMYMGGGNVMEIAPPPDPTTKSGAGFGREVEFAAWAESSYKSIFRRVSVAPPGGGPNVMSELMEAPFTIRHQWFPFETVVGLMVGGITESNWAP